MTNNDKHSRLLKIYDRKKLYDARSQIGVVVQDLSQISSASRLEITSWNNSRTLSNNISEPQYTFYSDCRQCPRITRLAHCVHLSREY